MDQQKIYRTQSSSGTERDKVIAPDGWLAIRELDEQAIENLRERNEQYVNDHLAFAAIRSEQLIAVLYEVPGIKVEEAYLRMVDTKSFHLLLLVGQKDYLSPYLMAARIIAEKYTEYEAFDMRVTFSIRAEHIKTPAHINGTYFLRPNDEHSIAAAI
jgi:hypothetical protein